MISAAAAAAAPSDADAWTAVKAARRGAVVPAGLAQHPLCRALLPVATAPAIVIAQIGQSLDGRTATVTGASHYINGEAALDHLHRLRALVDAVVVGVGTVCADDCRLNVRRVDGPSPARVVIDPSGRMPPEARAFADDGLRRVVIRGDGAPHCEVPGVETVHLTRCNGRIAPGDVVAALARRGMRRLLIEGGANTVSAFMAAGVIDRLHVMVAPLLVGSGREGLALAPIDRLEFALRPQATVHALGTDVLFDCDMRTAAPTASRQGEDHAHEHTDRGLSPSGRPLHADG